MWGHVALPPFSPRGIPDNLQYDEKKNLETSNNDQKSTDEPTCVIHSPA
jgi:hypothetical protein